MKNKLTEQQMKELQSEIDEERNREHLQSYEDEEFNEWLDYNRTDLMKEFIEDYKDDFLEFVKSVWRSTR